MVARLKWVFGVIVKVVLVEVLSSQVVRSGYCSVEVVVSSGSKSSGGFVV